MELRFTAAWTNKVASTVALALLLEDGEGVGVARCVKSDFERRDSVTHHSSCN